MGIRFLKADPNVKLVRPAGFTYPVGLTGGSVSSVAVLKGDFVGVAEGFAVGGAVGLFVTAKGLCVG